MKRRTATVSALKWLFKSLLAVAFVFTTYKFLRPFFLVKSITCSTNYGPCPQLVLEKLQQFNQIPIYRLDQTKIASELPYPLLEFRPNFPSSVFVKIDLPKPIVILKSNSTSLLVSSTGRILGSASGQNFRDTKIKAVFSGAV